ncbi:MAG: hypothetical protein CL834_05450 [Crocinitomicaceae bacterium]|nr:hypothetical protein [Crocinitomicaceae bacterium]
MTKADQWDPSLENIMDACPDAIWEELVWAIGSVPLMAGESSQLPTLWSSNYHLQARHSMRIQCQKWSEMADPESAILGKKPIRLGKRFEQLVNCWFETSHEYTVLAKNIVVQGQKRTLGEMDLILQDNETSEVTHLELACKFYLQASNSRAWSNWIGMDPSDRLDLKLSKLSTQLNLDQTPEAQAILKSEGIQVNAHAAWIKGWFFVHFREARKARLPYHSHHNVSTGWWCTQSEWHTIWQPQVSWIIIPAHHWLRTRHDPIEANMVMTLDDSLNALKKWKHIMVAQVEMRGGLWHEIIRGAIIRDGWPSA